MRWLLRRALRGLAVCFLLTDPGPAGAEARADVECPTGIGGSARPIRVLYHLQAVAGQEDALVEGLRAPGASSSLLLQRRGERSEFLAVIGWARCEDWRTSRNAARPGAELGGIIERSTRRAELVSVELLEELEDRLDDTPGHTMIRLYRVVVEPGAEDVFRDAWRAATAARAAHRGARGGLLLHDPKHPHAFVELVRWNSEGDWQASVRAGPGPFDAYDTLFWVRTLESKEIYDEVAVRTGTG